MLFSSPEYFLFLIVILALYYAVKFRVQNTLLLVASYLFYGFWDYRFLSLIFISTVIDFYVGQAIARSAKTTSKKLYLAISIVANLGILGFFKYFNFFIDNAENLLSAIGFQPNLPVLYVILPVGISFYTFQTMAYSIEIYRDKLKPVNNFLDFALYVCYFPQLVAGPIERPQNLIPALQTKRLVNTESFVSGGMLILIGLFRKVMIADGIGSQVDQIFLAPHNYSSPQLMMGIYLFALQIYCDFAGYSDIARGTSRLLGIELMENFHQPYLSANITEFWRRWHISLSTWLRDYLYIPLGGNRGGLVNTYRNLMITMILGGLWHGPAWTFIIWGGLHGSYLIGHRLLTRNQKVVDSPATSTLWHWRRLASMAFTFHLVLLTWVFFRAPGLRAAIDYLVLIFTFRNLETWKTVLPTILIPWLLVLAIDIPQYLNNNQTVVLRWPNVARNTAIAAMLFFVLLGVGTRAPFIYFQF